VDATGPTLKTFRVSMNMIIFIMIEAIWVQIATSCEVFSEIFGIFRAISLYISGTTYPKPNLISMASATSKNFALLQKPLPGKSNIARKFRSSRHVITSNTGRRWKLVSLPKKPVSTFPSRIAANPKPVAHCKTTVPRCFWRSVAAQAKGSIINNIHYARAALQIDNATYQRPLSINHRGHSDPRLLSASLKDFFTLIKFCIYRRQQNEKIIGRAKRKMNKVGENLAL